MNTIRQRVNPGGGDMRPRRPRTPRAELRAVEERARALFMHAPCGMYTVTPDGQAVRANPALLCLLGYGPLEDVRGLPTAHWYQQRSDYDAWLAVCLSTPGVVATREVAWRTRDETDLTVRLTGPIAATDPILGRVVDVCVEAVTEPRAEEIARTSSASKTDGFGSLAGEIGHEFNNLIMVILGYADQLIERVAPAQPMHADLLEIQKAGDRAAALTQRLLVYSRQQMRDAAALARAQPTPSAEPSARPRQFRPRNVPRV